MKYKGNKTTGIPKRKCIECHKYLVVVHDFKFLKGFDRFYTGKWCYRRGKHFCTGLCAERWANRQADKLERQGPIQHGVTH